MSACCQNAIWPKGSEKPIRCELEQGHGGPHQAGDHTWTSEWETMTVDRRGDT